MIEGKVRQIPETKVALDALREAGFFAATVDEDLGGMQLPFTVGQACAALFKGASVSTTGYLLLTRAAANLLETHGSEEQKRRLMAPMNTGRFFGTMYLSEPDVGSSLAYIRRRATPRGDGAYAITGNKMGHRQQDGAPATRWGTGNKMEISGGEHEPADNIVHRVLVKLPDAPPRPDLPVPYDEPSAYRRGPVVRHARGR